MPEDISLIIGLDARNTISLELFHENNALQLCRHLWRWWIPRKKIAPYFFAKLGKQPAFSDPSSASDHNKICTSGTQ
ncbi:MAG: hypothetical protein ACOVOR_04095 [Rhabdochlamydiaceae bacterium]